MMYQWNREILTKVINCELNNLISLFHTKYYTNDITKKGFSGKLQQLTTFKFSAIGNNYENT